MVGFRLRACSNNEVSGLQAGLTQVVLSVHKERVCLSLKGRLKATGVSVCGTINQVSTRMRGVSSPDGLSRYTGWPISLTSNRPGIYSMSVTGNWIVVGIEWFLELGREGEFSRDKGPVRR